MALLQRHAGQGQGAEIKGQMQGRAQGHGWGTGLRNCTIALISDLDSEHLLLSSCCEFSAQGDCVEVWEIVCFLVNLSMREAGYTPCGLGPPGVLLLPLRLLPARAHKPVVSGQLHILSQQPFGAGEKTLLGPGSLSGVAPKS